jgi:hypothetical protein
LTEVPHVGQFVFFPSISTRSSVSESGTEIGHGNSQPHLPHFNLTF